MSASVQARLNALEHEVFDVSCLEDNNKGLHNRVAYLEALVRLLNRDLTASIAENEALRKALTTHKEWVKADLQVDMDEARRDLRDMKKHIEGIQTELDVVRLQVQELLERRWTTGES